MTLDIFKLTTTEAMSSCNDQFVKIGIVFHVLYFKNEVSDPQSFCSFDKGNSLSDSHKSMKKSVVEVFGTKHYP